MELIKSTGKNDDLSFGSSTKNDEFTSKTSGGVVAITSSLLCWLFTIALYEHCFKYFYEHLTWLLCFHLFIILLQFLNKDEYLKGIEIYESIIKDFASFIEIKRDESREEL